MAVATSITATVPLRMKLSELIKQERFASPGQKALLNVIVTSSWLTSQMSDTLDDYDLTPAQYNVLRILRGSHPETLTCTGIGERLLDRTPDVTRLLNRLQRNHLIERARAEHDRRVVEVGITEKGLALLEEMDDDVAATQQRMMRHLTDEEHRQLNQLLERLRTDQ